MLWQFFSPWYRKWYGIWIFFKVSYRSYKFQYRDNTTINIFIRSSTSLSFFSYIGKPARRDFQKKKIREMEEKWFFFYMLFLLGNPLVLESMQNTHLKVYFIAFSLLRL